MNQKLEKQALTIVACASAGLITSLGSFEVTNPDLKKDMEFVKITLQAVIDKHPDKIVAWGRRRMEEWSKVLVALGVPEENSLGVLCALSFRALTELDERLPYCDMKATLATLFSPMVRISHYFGQQDATRNEILVDRITQALYDIIGFKTRAELLNAETANTVMRTLKGYDFDISEGEWVEVWVNDVGYDCQRNEDRTITIYGTVSDKYNPGYITTDFENVIRTIKCP